MRLPTLFIALTLLAACAEEGADQFVQPVPEDGASDAGATATGPAIAAQATGPDPAVIPDRFQGTWASGPAQCGQSADDSHMVLRATDVEFHESGGPVTAVDVEDNRLRFTAELTGEGESWMADLALELSPEGNTLTDTAVGLSRVRCS